MRKQLFWMFYNSIDFVWCYSGVSKGSHYGDEPWDYVEDWLIRASRGFKYRLMYGLPSKPESAVVIVEITR